MTRIPDPVAVSTVHPVADDEEWLDIDEAAHYLNLPNRTIRRRIAAGEFEAVGSPARIRRQELDDFIERSRIKPGALAHLLNEYPAGASRFGEVPITSKGRPDRRFGPRYSARSQQNTSDASSRSR